MQVYYGWVSVINIVCSYSWLRLLNRQTKKLYTIKKMSLLANSKAWAVKVSSADIAKETTGPYGALKSTRRLKSLLSDVQFASVISPATPAPLICKWSLVGLVKSRESPSPRFVAIIHSGTLTWPRFMRDAPSRIKWLGNSMALLSSLTSGEKMPSEPSEFLTG